jgi:hypothetical protein
MKLYLQGKEHMTPAKKAQTMKPKTLNRVRLDDNRELRILRIQTGFGEDLIRVGVNLMPGGENMSGAVFPESYLNEVITALEEVKSA